MEGILPAYLVFCFFFPSYQFREDSQDVILMEEQLLRIRVPPEVSSVHWWVMLAIPEGQAVPVCVVLH